MSLSDIRSECSDVAGLLQPFVDGELSEEECDRVAGHLESCKGCRAAVSEQSWVRATLRALPREPAPQAVRAKILLALDEVDREAAATVVPPTPAPPGWWTRVRSRLSDLGRGSMIMVPAAAAAVGLFFVVKDASVPTAEPGTTPVGMASALSPSTRVRPETSANVQDEPDPTHALSKLEPRVGFEPQVPHAAGVTDQVQLVGADVDGSTANAARLRFELMRGGEPTGHHFIDRQQRSDGSALRGEPMSVGGRQYHLERDDRGAAVLHFVVDSVVHTVRLEGASIRPVGEAIVDDEGQRSPADVSALLRFALGFRQG